MTKDFSHIQNPVMVYSPEGDYTIIERQRLSAALEAGWSETPPEGTIHSQPRAYEGEIDFSTTDPAQAAENSEDAEASPPPKVEGKPAKKGKNSIATPTLAA